MGTPIPWATAAVRGSPPSIGNPIHISPRGPLRACVGRGCAYDRRHAASRDRLRGDRARRRAHGVGARACARLGAFADLRITGRAEVSGAAGLSVSLPASGNPGNGGTFVVLSAGGAVHDRGGATPAALGRLWWGLRAPPEASSHYEIAVGLWAEARYFPGDGTVDALAGVSVDFYALALPVI
ncbi:MAG: hypothetical protein Q8S73_41730 [Deltaproteobacteria bacterium]|nr:hypothetical protein [Myxococcales bacterium]MDP3220681.1 hypothetical protein [Deltaproteobacteria bacterium]